MIGSERDVMLEQLRVIFGDIDMGLLDPEAVRAARQRRAASVIERERARKDRQRIEQRLQRHRLAPHALRHGRINLLIRILNRRNHQLRVALGGRCDV